MNLGYDPNRHVGAADLIMVMESDVPWMPAHATPAADCKVIQCGFDPLHTGIPIRGFASDLGITGGAAAILTALTPALARQVDKTAVEARRKRTAVEREKLVRERATARQAAATRVPIHPAWVSHCIDQAKDPRTIVVNEYTLRLDHCAFEHADTYFGSSSASGLGWGTGAALGAKLGAPDRPVIAVVGDGAYLFGNPAAVHYASAMHDLPVLFVVMNNGMWNAVRRSAVAMYPGGRASRSNTTPFMRLENLPAFEQICAAAGGFGERVEDPAALPGALQRAMAVVAGEKRQALLNVICSAE